MNLEIASATVCGSVVGSHAALQSLAPETTLQMFTKLKVKTRFPTEFPPVSDWRGPNAATK